MYKEPLIEAEDCWEVAVEQVVVDGFVLTVGDLVIVEVDLVEDGLIKVTAGVVGGCEVLLLSIMEDRQALVEGAMELVPGGLQVVEVAFGGGLAGS